MNPPDHTKFIVSWLGIIALVCICMSAALLYKGFQQGELLVGIAGSAVGSLGTLVAVRRTGSNGQPSVENPTLVSTTTTEAKAP